MEPTASGGAGLHHRELPSKGNTMSLALAISRIKRTRAYTMQLLDDVEDELWLVKPDGCPTHIAWQVGHIAMAQYAVCLMRVRDAQPGDRDIMSRAFRKQFSKGTTPVEQSDSPFSPAEIRNTFDAVHAQVMKEVPTFDEAELTKELAAPHEMFATKIAALHFSADHEMLHAGQIGLLRRMLGKAPVR